MFKGKMFLHTNETGAYNPELKDPPKTPELKDPLKTIAPPVFWEI